MKCRAPGTIGPGHGLEGRELRPPAFYGLQTRRPSGSMPQPCFGAVSGSGGGVADSTQKGAPLGSMPQRAFGLIDCGVPRSKPSTRRRTACPLASSALSQESGRACAAGPPRVKPRISTRAERRSGFRFMIPSLKARSFRTVRHGPAHPSQWSLLVSGIPFPKPMPKLHGKQLIRDLRSPKPLHPQQKYLVQANLLG
jgi:hypothetical protein